MCAYSPIPQNGVKIEMFPPPNDHTMELSVNFLLTATSRQTRFSDIHRVFPKGVVLPQSGCGF